MADFFLPSGYSLIKQEATANDSDHYKCYYGDPLVASRPLYELDCAKSTGCCQDNCCAVGAVTSLASSNVWVGGIIVLAIFCFVLLIVGVILVIICVTRSRAKKSAFQYQHPTGSYAPSVIQQPQPTYGYMYQQPPQSELRYNIFDAASIKRY